MYCTCVPAYLCACLCVWGIPAGHMVDPLLQLLLRHIAILIGVNLIHDNPGKGGRGGRERERERDREREREEEKGEGEGVRE